MPARGHFSCKTMIYDLSIVIFKIRIFIAEHSKLATGELMISSAQMRAARALLGLDQRQLADLSGVSVPTIQRMEASEGQVRGNVDTLVKVIEALDQAGVVLIAEGAVSDGGGRGVRLKQSSPADGSGDGPGSS